MQNFLEHYNYYVVIILMMIGLYVVFASSNMVKKLVGLSVFQTSLFLLYITLAKVTGGRPPILDKSEISYGHGDDYADKADAQTGAENAAHSAIDNSHEVVEVVYANALPHVLILTAIVVGVATLAIGLALVVRTREAYGTIEEDEIDELDYRANLEGTDA